MRVTIIWDGKSANGSSIKFTVDDPNAVTTSMVNKLMHALAERLAKVQRLVNEKERLCAEMLQMERALLAAYPSRPKDDKPSMRDRVAAALDDCGGQATSSEIASWPGWTVTRKTVLGWMSEHGARHFKLKKSGGQVIWSHGRFTKPKG